MLLSPWRALTSLGKPRLCVLEAGKDSTVPINLLFLWLLPHSFHYFRTWVHKILFLVFKPLPWNTLSILDLAFHGRCGIGEVFRSNKGFTLQYLKTRRELGKQDGVRHLCHSALAHTQRASDPSWPLAWAQRGCDGLEWTVLVISHIYRQHNKPHCRLVSSWAMKSKIYHPKTCFYTFIKQIGKEIYQYRSHE